jgi:hypothetical protein
MAAFKFDWTIADAPKSAGVLAHGRMYHATQASNVPSILDSGLQTGGASQGILTRLDSRYRHHWSDDFYGMRPIYLLLEPVIPRMYGWPDSENGGDEEPVILEVDTSDVRLLPDLPTFEIPYFAFAGPRGVHWYDRKRGMVERPDPSAVPPAFVPFADDVGVVPYEILATVAARIAIDFTKTAATLAQIPPSQISLRV